MFKKIICVVLPVVLAIAMCGCHQSTTQSNTMTTTSMVDEIEDEIPEIIIEIEEEPVEDIVEEEAPGPIESTESEVEIVLPTKSEVEESTPEEPSVDESEDDDEVVVETNLVSLGEFRLTAYCNCSKCCGQWAGGPTASGVMPQANRTIAVDRSVIPLGTKVVINGQTYVAEDVGGAIKGNRIDVYMESHNAAMDFGVRYAEVFIVQE